MHTLGDLIDGLARAPGAPALMAADDETWSRSRLQASALRFAAGLVGAGVRPGEVVGLLGPNRPEWVVALLGVVRAGAVAMPLSEQITDEDLERVLAHSGCRRVITTAAFVARLHTLGRVQLVLLDDEPAAEPQPSGTARDASGLPPLRADQTVLLLYTSGTTGTPKGVPLSHANVAANLAALEAAHLARPGDRVLLPLPLHHAYPLTVGLLAPLAVGAVVVLPAGITAPQIARALAAGRCTIMVGVPRLYEAMLDGIDRQLHARGRLVEGTLQGALALAARVQRRFGWQIGRFCFWPIRRRIGPELRLLASGGAHLEPGIADRLEVLGWQVLTGYGLTETAPILTFNPPDRPRRGSAGLPVAGVELRLGPVDNGAPGQGEILARGPNVFAGYWRNPEETARAFTADGFFRTGDLGYLDPDGYLHIVGRAKELIVLAGGKNVLPEEVEAGYRESDVVREVAILERGGRLVGLFVPRDDALALPPEALRQRLRGEVERRSKVMPAYARLTDFAVTPEPLPRTQIGKLRRHQLAAIYERALAGTTPGTPSATLSEADHALLAAPRVSGVWAWLSDRFADRRATLDASLQLDLGLDSFEWMSLAMELEERFGVRLSEDALARVTTLRSLLLEIRQAAEAAADQGRAEVEPGAAEASWLRPRGLVLEAAARGLFVLNRWIMRGLFGVRADGLEHCPAAGPFLVAPNHTSYLDPFALAAVLPWAQLRNLYWAGWVGLLFRGPLTRLFSRALQVLPVDPERGLTSSLTLGRAVLERGQALVWFPEGQRSTEGRLLPFLPGVGLLLQRTGVPAVPVRIDGAFKAWPPGGRWPRLHPIRLRFGAPLTFADLAAHDGADRHRRIADRLHDEVASLAPAA